MPSEFRQVRFSSNELIESLYEHNRVAQTKLPQGIVIPDTPVAAANVAVCLELGDQASGETQVASLARELVAAALLRSCIKQRISMPRDAAKTIQIYGDGASLNTAYRGPGKTVGTGGFRRG